MSNFPRTRALLLAGKGEDLPRAEVEILRQGRHLVCVAEAWQVARDYDWRPDIVLGQLSHLPENVRTDWQQQGTRFMPLSSAYPYSELEFALNYLITTGVRDILLLGLISTRLTTTLARLFLLARPEWGAARLSFVHGPERGYILRHGESVRLDVSPHDKVTLLPLTSTVTALTARGVSPALRGASLAFGTAMELTLEERPVQLWIGAGCLLVIHERPRLPSPPS